MVTDTRAALVELAAGSLVDNAYDTVVERLGTKAYAAMSWNEQQFAVDTEKLAQIGYFVDTYGVTEAELLAELHLVRD